MQLRCASVAGAGTAAAIYSISERGGLDVQVDDRVVVDARGFEPDAVVIARADLVGGAYRS